MIKAVFFDLGGVIVRTEYQAPRQHLAVRLGMEYEDVVKLIFQSPSSERASVGEISAEEHWAEVTKRLRRPVSETESIREEFFAGDVVDREIVDLLRSLRPRYHVGLISNAWPDLRDYIVKQKFDDAFDHMVISGGGGCDEARSKDLPDCAGAGRGESERSGLRRRFHRKYRRL